MISLAQTMDSLKRHFKKNIGPERASRMKKQMNEQLFNLRNRTRRMTLEKIGRFFRTDKVYRHHIFKGLSYLGVYENYFKNLRDQSINVLEIGVKDAASLKTWKAYFPKGKIFGIDIDPRCKALSESRIEIEIGSQDDIEFLSQAFDPNIQFNIIIDDGSHINRHIIQSFEHLFYNRLLSGGLYIIEDLVCSYEPLQSKYDILSNWPGMKYNTPEQNYDNQRKDMDVFFEQKIRALDHQKGKIMSLHFWSMVCIILKT